MGSPCIDLLYCEKRAMRYFSNKGCKPIIFSIKDLLYLVSKKILYVYNLYE